MNALAVRPIRNDNDYRAALEDIDCVIDSAEGTPEFDKLEVLSVLVADYEDKHHAIEPPDRVSFLEFVMESRDLTRKDLETYIGSRSRVAGIMNRKRALSIEMVRRLRKGLDLPTDLLIEPYSLAKSRNAA